MLPAHFRALKYVPSISDDVVNGVGLRSQVDAFAVGDPRTVAHADVVGVSATVGRGLLRSGVGTDVGLCRVGARRSDGVDDFDVAVAARR